MASDVCRRARDGQDEAAISSSLAKRAATMQASLPTYPIDLARAEPAGEANAPVALVAYVCVRCPYCSRLIPDLYKLVTTGALKGKAKLYLRLFPIRSHDHATESALALQAAQGTGKFWPLTLRLYGDFDRFDPARLADIASAAGLEKDSFRKRLDDPSTRAALVDAKKEGIRNRVTATPTLFLNGRRYVADLDATVIADLVEEEAETAAQSRKTPDRANQ
jgi:protein-disulfide isomerase